MGDLAALGRLLEEHRPPLLGMIRRRLDPALAARIDPEDIFSQALFEARRKWKAFREQGREAPYH